MAVDVVAPVPGRVVGLSGVPDEVFAAGMVGPGSAVDPVRAPGTAVAPVSGVVRKLHPHAYVIVAGDGRGVLVHLGVDTVQLAGEGFRTLVAEGDEVAAGDAIVAWDPVAVEAGGRSAVCPVIALDADRADVHGEASGQVAAADPLYTWE